MLLTMIQTILHLSDTHGLHLQLGTLPNADVLIHSGDFTMGGTEKEALNFMEWFITQPHQYKIFIAGNHDDCLYQAYLEGLPDNMHYLCNSSTEIEGINFYGLPMFVEDNMTGQYEKYILEIPRNVDVLITHQPPLGIHDYSEGIYWGNPFLLEQANRSNPKMHLFGHIHDAYGIEKIDDTLYANSSLVDNQYNLANKPQLLFYE